jgi:hypothetical protein
LAAPDVDSAFIVGDEDDVQEGRYCLVLP